jgi:hypothetical protein
MLVVPRVFAQTNDLTGNLVRYHNLADFIRAFIRVAFMVGGITTLFVIMWGGLKFITSGGDEEKMAAAKRTIISGLIGLAIIALAPMIINLLTAFFGIPLDTTLLDQPVR